MKAGYGKTVRPVCAADGGKLFIGRLLRPDSWEVGEQSGAIRSGADGAKGGDQGECGPAKHAPDAEPDKRVTGAGLSLTATNSVFQDARLQPFLDQADDAPVADPVLQETDQPLLTNRVKERRGCRRPQ